MQGRLVIVGAGECGARAAVVARQGGWRGEIVLVGGEPHPPYERPQLSKQYLTELDHVVKANSDAEQFDGLSIRHLRSQRAVSIDRFNRRVSLESGAVLEYQSLLLATGARPRTFAPHIEGAIYLRDQSDSEKIRQALGEKKDIVIIGGGFIGLEVAAAAIGIAKSVTVIETQPRLLSRGVPASVATILEAKHRSMGVKFLFGSGVANIRHKAGGYRIDLENGLFVEGEALVVGIGSQPNVELARHAGLEVDNGIVTDEYLRTRDPSIFAAGDCASVRHPRFGMHLRLESWRNALEQGELAARNILGERVAQDAVPWFWSDQYDLCLQVAGLPASGKTAIENRPDTGGLLNFHLDGEGRLVGASGIGSLKSIGKSMRLAEMLIAKGSSPDPVMLARPDVSLKSML